MSAGTPTFALTTPDPQFDPRAPITVNGFTFHPAERAITALEDDEMGGQIDG